MLKLRHQFTYELVESQDKWIELSCPIMIFCIVLLIFLPSCLPLESFHNLVKVNSTLYIVLRMLPSQLIFIVPILCVAMLVSKQIPLVKKLNLTTWNNSYISEAITWELILVVPLTLLAAVIYFIFLHYGYNFISPVVELLSKANKLGIGFVFFFAVFIAPIIEEIAFRRTLFVFMTPMFGAFPAAIITSLIFALLHGGIVQILPLFILAMVLQYLYLKHKSLFPCILLHSMHNCIIMVLYLSLRA